MNDDGSNADDGTLDFMNHPPSMIFRMKANAEDNPTWEQAMNGQNSKTVTATGKHAKKRSKCCKMIKSLLVNQW